MDKNSRVLVEPHQFAGVDINHPTLMEYARNFAKMYLDGDHQKDTAYIAKRVGLPYQVVRKIENEVRQARQLKELQKT